MFKLLGNNYYSPIATEVAIEQRSSKLFLPKYHILNSGNIYGSITACCISSIKYFVWHIIVCKKCSIFSIIIPRLSSLHSINFATQSTQQPMPKLSISPIAGNNRKGIDMSFFVVMTSFVLKVQNYTFIFKHQNILQFSCRQTSFRNPLQ